MSFWFSLRLLSMIFVREVSVQRQVIGNNEQKESGASSIF